VISARVVQKSRKNASRSRIEYKFNYGPLASGVTRQAEGGEDVSPYLRIRRAIMRSVNRILASALLSFSRRSRSAIEEAVGFTATRFVLRARTIDMDFHAKSTHHRTFAIRRSVLGNHPDKNSMIKAILSFRVAIPARFNRPTVNPPFIFFFFFFSFSPIRRIKCGNELSYRNRDGPRERERERDGRVGEREGGA